MLASGANRSSCFLSDSQASWNASKNSGAFFAAALIYADRSVSAQLSLELPPSILRDGLVYPVVVRRWFESPCSGEFQHDNYKDTTESPQGSPRTDAMISVGGAVRIVRNRVTSL